MGNELIKVGEAGDLDENYFLCVGYNMLKQHDIMTFAKLCVRGKIPFTIEDLEGFLMDEDVYWYLIEVGIKSLF